MWTSFISTTIFESSSYFTVRHLSHKQSPSIHSHQYLALHSPENSLLDEILYFIPSSAPIHLRSISVCSPIPSMSPNYFRMPWFTRSKFDSWYPFLEPTLTPSYRTLSISSAHGSEPHNTYVSCNAPPPHQLPNFCSNGQTSPFLQVPQSSRILPSFFGSAP